MTASSTTFTGAADANITVNSGGMLRISSSTYSGLRLNLKPGSTDSVFNVVFSGTLTVDSAANTVTPAGPTITGNDFSSVGADGIVASGDQNATIYLTGNYWGTTDPIQIAAKIDDHNDNGNLPTIAFSPYITMAPAAPPPLPSPHLQPHRPDPQSLRDGLHHRRHPHRWRDGTFTILNGTRSSVRPPCPRSYPTATSTAEYTLPEKLQPASTSSRQVTAVQPITCPRPTRFIS